MVATSELHQIDTSAGISFGSLMTNSAAVSGSIDRFNAGIKFSVAKDDVSAVLSRESLTMLRVTQTLEPMKPSAAAATQAPKQIV